MFKPSDTPILLELPQAIALHVTSEQFTALALANRDLKLELTDTGELLVNPPTGGQSGNRNLRLSTQLGIWAQTYEELGEAFDSSTGFRLPNGAIVSPDAAWISRSRWESLSPEEQKGFVPLCPDFIIELRSESDRLSKLQTKLEQYINNGTKLGWLIDPMNRRVEIYRPDRTKEILVNPYTLSGEDILPNFTLDLRKIWT